MSDGTDTLSFLDPKTLRGGEDDARAGRRQSRSGI